MDTVPDEQCRVGPATHGYDLYSWECVDGEHVIVDEMGENCELPPDSLIWE
jgi:hypothetical protein